MKFKTFLAAGVAALFVTSVAAHATTITGPYVSLGAGADITQTQHNTSKFGPSTDLRHKTGYDGFASAGYGFGNGLRVEVEGIYLQSNASGYLAKNHSQAYGGLVNVIHDIDLKEHFGLDVPVTPYVGVGAGYLVGNYNIHSPVRDITGTQGSFGYQGIVGAAFDTPVPGLQATVDYRMIGQTMSNDSYHTDDSHFDHRFNHTFNVGLRYQFNTPAVSPVQVADVAPPVATPARTYLVFFDWDKSNLTARARQIVAEAAQASTHVQTTRIEVNSYTDNSSARGGAAGAKYNMGLSIRRANSVKAELVRDGVPASAIDIHGYGEQHPLVPTGPNTREPQNRRVEIVLK